MITIGNKNGVNWHKIRAEYIGGASQRSLAEKYHVSRDSIARHCREEKWTALRESAKSEVTQSVIQKTADLAADNATIAAGIKRKALMILDRLFDGYLYTSTEHQQFGPGSKDISRLRDLTAAYKDLTEDMPKNEADKNAPIYELLKKLDGECGV